jgi:3-phenylpropionate/trans-cinnamate dioxygenase alpha subunit
MAMDLAEVEQLVSVERGEISRRIYSDPEIYEQEMELIFGRAWLFVAHDSMLRSPGDFFEAPMGKDNVLIVRQKDGSVKGLLNTCTHRGNAVCRAEEGNTKNFMCTYHGWTFAITGELIGVPGFENLYHSELDKAALGLREVAQIDTYKGFIFATMDPSAPPLLEFLGTTGRLSLDLIHAQGDMEVIPGIQKYVIDCNWKFAVDNVFDYYHAPITHMSASAPGVREARGQAAPQVEADPTQIIDRGGALKSDGSNLEVPNGRTSLESLVIIGEYGHTIGGPTTESARTGPNGVQQNAWRDRPGVADVLGPVGIRSAGHPNVFPTAWVTESPQLCLRVPRSPNKTELWWFSFVDKSSSPEEQKAQLNRVIHVFGPAGFLEQEDGENWSQSTRQTNGYVSKRIPHALKMDVGRGKVIKEHGLARIEGNNTEHAQMWTYAAWAQWMTGADWDTLKAKTEPVDVL